MTYNSLLLGVKFRESNLGALENMLSLETRSKLGCSPWVNWGVDYWCFEILNGGGRKTYKFSLVTIKFRHHLFGCSSLVHAHCK